jgi:hypothetical protein
MRHTTCQKSAGQNLSGHLVGTELSLAGGQRICRFLGNVKVHDPKFNEHFMEASLWHDGKWFNLARYHDFDAVKRGPQALADFLGMPLDEVFPISYDIRGLSLGDAGSLVGRIEKEPRERLTRAEVIRMAVPKKRA